MRVYYSGQKINMVDVTWECLCDPKTRVTGEDPEAVFPDNVAAERDKALENLTEMFSPKKAPWWWRLFRYFRHKPESISPIATD